MHQLGNRTFRFSVASNRVGHFIYGLKDRVWPDFVCHFQLFKDYVDYSYFDGHWRMDDEICEISARTPLAIKTNLDFLQNSAAHDNSTHKELSKFGFLTDQGSDSISKPIEPISFSLDEAGSDIAQDPVPDHSRFFVHPDHSVIKLGSLVFPNSQRTVQNSAIILQGNIWRRDYWKKLSPDILVAPFV